MEVLNLTTCCHESCLVANGFVDTPRPFHVQFSINIGIARPPAANIRFIFNAVVMEGHYVNSMALLQNSNTQILIHFTHGIDALQPIGCGYFLTPVA